MARWSRYARLRRQVLLVGGLVVLSATAVWGAPTAGDDDLKFYGDLRLRLESDWASTMPDGTERDDRDRLRARARFGFVYRWSTGVTFGARLRTGDRAARQSPHVTLGSELVPKEVALDRLFVEARHGAWWIWGGKNTFPFWKQNELFWDDDVTPEGIAFGYGWQVGERFDVDVRGAAFVLDDAQISDRFAGQARLLGAQVSARTTAGAVDFAGAAGVVAIRDNPEVANPALDDLDYSFIVASFQARLAAARLTFGADLMRNVEDYPASLWNRQQRTGYVLSVSYGVLHESRDWLVAAYFAHIEKYAVAAAFAQDDWHRWGSATETRASNFEGAELRATYMIGPKLGVTARYFRVRGIEHESAAAGELEDGQRLRLDLDIGF